MNIDVSNINLTLTEKKEIEQLLKKQNLDIKDDLRQMWYLMDLVWDEFECDNKNLDWVRISKFYSHPVWLLNGLFIEQHPVSMKHRHAISAWIVAKEFKKILDYGGGYGTLARLIAQKKPQLEIFIYEPYPSVFGLKRIKEFKNIHIIDKIEERYDCLVSTSVLEHLPDPLNEFEKMIKSVEIDGYLLIANDFYPVIKCHLPQTFHLRYSFNLFARMMGLKIVGQLEDSPAIIYKKTQEIKPNRGEIRLFEKLSKTLFPAVEVLKPVLRKVLRAIFK